MTHSGVVTLEPKVMAVLLALADRPREVVTRQSLVDTIWAREDGGDESLTRAVSLLREALGARDVIETIPKRGYRLTWLPEPPEAPAPVAAGSTGAGVETHSGTTSPGRRGLFAEAHRRRVFRTAGLYVVGTWLLLQLADVVFPGFGIQDEAIRRLIWAAIAGFPIALLVGWRYDIGADGIRRTRPAADGPGARLGPLDGVILGTSALVLAGLVAAAIVTPRVPIEAQSGTDAVVAVLPFHADSREERFFAEGIAEEILNRLRRSDDLKVLGRQSSFSLADAGMEPGAVADALGARYLVRGSISHGGDRLLIRAELVDAAGKRLWGEVFDATVGDLMAMKADIVDAVARVLGAGSTPLGVAERPPDPEAYEHFLIGRRMLQLRSHNFDSRTVEALRRAVALDPGYALAHAELAIAYRLSAGWVEGFTYDELGELARRHVETALRLEPELARAHAARGLVDDDSASLRRALALDPDDVDALNWLSGHLERRGKLRESMALLERAVAIDPLAVIPGVNLAMSQIENGNEAVAVERLERLWRLPTRPDEVGLVLAALKRQQGHVLESCRIEQERLRLSVDRIGRLMSLYLVECYALLGAWDEAWYWQERMEARHDGPWWIFKSHGDLLLWQGRHAEAADYFDARYPSHPEGTEGYPESPIHRHTLARSLAGRHAAALALLDRLDDIAAHPDNYWQSLHARAWSLQALRREAAATEVLASIEDVRGDAMPLRSPTAFALAQNAVLLGNHDEALERFDEAVALGWRDFERIRHDPRWAPLGKYPRYRELVARVSADLAEQRARMRELDADEGLVEDIDRRLARFDQAEADGRVGRRP